jgi:hypothetical protein
LAVLALFVLPTPTQAEPATRPAATQPAQANTPSAAMHRYFQALDASDRKGALDCWNAANPTEAQLAKLQVDMMLAVSKLKKAVRVKWGDASPYDLRMAVVGEGECGPITEHVNGDVATIDVASRDERLLQSDRHYSMVKAQGHWKLSTIEQLKDRPANAPMDAELAMAQALIKTINSTADQVTSGQLRNISDVQQRISDSMGAP